ncbi:hypothetical protein [Ascidiaceihabitans sp.]|uniref:hypothetical protein n=1 Tax=Ascidiaceihabitans sp. TaxID=1872644 RepID=UPI00329A15E2
MDKTSQVDHGHTGDVRDDPRVMFGRTSVQRSRCKIALVVRTIGAERGRAARGRPVQG